MSGETRGRRGGRGGAHPGDEAVHTAACVIASATVATCGWYCSLRSAWEAAPAPAGAEVQPAADGDSAHGGLYDTPREVEPHRKDVLRPTKKREEGPDRHASRSAGDKAPSQRSTMDATPPVEAAPASSVVSSVQEAPPSALCGRVGRVRGRGSKGTTRWGRACATGGRCR